MHEVAYYTCIIRTCAIMICNISVQNVQSPFPEMPITRRNREKANRLSIRVRMVNLISLDSRPFASCSQEHAAWKKRERDQPRHVSALARNQKFRLMRGSVCARKWLFACSSMAFPNLVGLSCFF